MTELNTLHQVTVLGTPAEEAIGGKIDLINAGAFADIDLVFMAHPAQQDALFLPCVALDEYVIFLHLIFFILENFCMSSLNEDHNFDHR